MVKITTMLAASGLALLGACRAAGGEDGAPESERPTLSAEERALLPPMERYETDFVTIDLPDGFETTDESYLGSIGLYGGDGTLEFEVFTAGEDSVAAQLEREAAHPTGLFKSFGWQERGREDLDEGVLVTGMGGGTASQPSRPIAYYVGPDGKGGLVEMTVETAFGTRVPPEQVYALARAMAVSMVVDELPDETSYAAFRSTQFGEIADVPRQRGEIDTDALAFLTVAALDAASTKAAAFSDAYGGASEDQWSPERVLSDLIPLAQDAATEHRAMIAYAEAWDEVMARGDPQAPTIRALALVGETGYSFLFDLAEHVTRVAELKERGRTEALATFRRENAPHLEEERDLYAYALAAYAAAKAGEAAPDAPSLGDAERQVRAARVAAAADDMRLAKSDPVALTAKYADEDAKRFSAPGASSSGGNEGRVRRPGFYPSVNFNPAGLDPFSNVNVVRVYGGMSLDPWD